MTVDHGDDQNLEPAAKSAKEQIIENYNEIFTRLLTKYVTHAAPRRFVLCRERCEDVEDWVYAWGAALEHIAVLFRANGKIIGTFNSADSALNLFSRTEDLRLIWIDPTILSQADAIPA
jgi:hypothetical protein